MINIKKKKQTLFLCLYVLLRSQITECTQRYRKGCRSIAIAAYTGHYNKQLRLNKMCASFQTDVWSK